MANSLVGSKINTRGSRLLKAFFEITLCMAGSKKAKVFPEPVFDDAIRSLPDRPTGIDCTWISVGFSMPICSRLVSRRLSSEKSENCKGVLQNNSQRALYIELSL